MTDPAAGLALFNAIAAAGKTVYDIAQGTSKIETKQQLMDVYDTLMNLKRRTADLEDENHKLNERLRFKTDDFDFRNPFWYEKTHPDRALCAKCFASHISAPMSEPYKSGDMSVRRRCLVCDTRIEIAPPPPPQRSSGPRSGPWS